MIGDELQRAIYASLDTAGVCDGRIYDSVPEKPVFPYITIGDEQVVDDSNACCDAWDLFPDVHIWSRPGRGGKVELKSLRAQVVTALLEITEVQGFSLVASSFQSARSVRDRDGITEHEIISMQFNIAAS